MAITARMVWEAANGSEFEGAGSWWEKARYIEGDAETPGIIEVTIDNPAWYGESITKR